MWFWEVGVFLVFTGWYAYYTKYNILVVLLDLVMFTAIWYESGFLNMRFSSSCSGLNDLAAVAGKVDSW